jgi:tRNA pseudouridine55 synthase
MFYLIDKPLDISSFDVIRKLRKILNIKKMWHAGTLDPLATWCLLIATENSTKLLPLLDDAEKEYITIIRLDGKSESLDRGTPIEAIDTSNMRERSNHEITEYLLSQTSQIPPRYSALHIDGERAYDRARKWEDFTIPERRISIREVELLERGLYTITIRIIISSGGYIRSLAPLMGAYLGIDGGYISELRRTKIFTRYGILDIWESCEIGSPVEISYSQLFHTIPTYYWDDATLDDLRLGKSVSIDLPIAHSEDALIFFRDKKSGYTSLCKKKDKEYTIVRNNV